MEEEEKNANATFAYPILGTVYHPSRLRSQSDVARRDETGVGKKRRTIGISYEFRRVFPLPTIISPCLSTPYDVTLKNLFSEVKVSYRQGKYRE